MITSKSNGYVTFAASLSRKKERDAAGAFVAEGARCVSEIPPGWPVRFILMSRMFADANDTEKYRDLGEVFHVSGEAFAKASGTVAPQGILAVCGKRDWGNMTEIAGNNPLFLMLDGVSEPGNVGALVRTADAAGASGVILSKGCADIYGPKAVRASAGSIFHVPVISEVCLPEITARLGFMGVSVYGAALDGADEAYELELGNPSAFVIGGEGDGLSDPVKAACGRLVRLPIIGRAESLNAAVAGGILLYEAVRQRRAGGL